MEFKDKSILLISPEPWDHVFVSKHHYAIYLANLGANVIFANPPKESWSLMSTEFSKVKVLNYAKFIKGLRKFPSILSRRLIKKKLDKIESYCGLSFDIIWSFDNSVFFDFTLLQKSFNISHIVDLDQDFELAKASRTSNICLFVTRQIGEKLKEFNENSHFINHGYNQKLMSEKIELPGSNHLKLLYAGNLNMYKIDWHTLLEVVSNHSNIDFIFLGPLDSNPDFRNQTIKSRKVTLSLQNSYHLGKVHSDALINYYSVSDALLICYQEKYHLEQSNCHKLMEYLGSGKLVIASQTAEFSHYNGSLLLMSTNNSELTDQVKTFSSNPSKFNTSQLSSMRKEIASSNTYEKQIGRISEIIDNQNFVQP